MLGESFQRYWINYDLPDCPGAGEIDIAEIFGNHTTVNQQIHVDGHHDQCQPVVDSSQYHTYQFIWQPGSLVWKIDGNTTCTITGSYVPSNPMFLIINVAIGGIGGGTVNPNIFPQQLVVDYIKITQP
jgi:beta-glucanase (GH16 family)